MTTLNAASLHALSPAVSVPTYDRSAVGSGIVHFGVGNFHRAHEAMFIDRLLNAGDTEWGICGVGVLPFDAAMKDTLAAQDGLYTLSTTSPQGVTESRIVGSLIEYLFAPDGPQAVMDKLVAPETRIVSLTVTEGGYSVDDATGEFAPNDEATLSDLADSLSAPARLPRSVLGYIVESLRRRRECGIPAFTVMSCDNIQGNGLVAKVAVVGFAARRDPALASWISEQVSFPSSMVDRITPATTDETRAALRAAHDIEDLWPVHSESFEQWVLEDAFPLGRPAFDTVGVQLVDDVEPYELMKLRLLNASHQAMSYLGILSGAQSVHEVCTDPLFATFLRQYMHDEAIPTLQPVPGINLTAYCDQLVARFSSEAIRDTLARQVVDASDRIPKFLLPVVAEQLSRGGQISHASLVLAAWSVFLEGHTDAGTPTAPVDRRLAELSGAVAAEAERPGSFLDYAPVFGTLGANATLRAAFIAARASLKAQGARKTLTQLTQI
ncbi:mannitol dehydrogenase family protein [Microbacterium sp. NPDC076911]|uniref:mannitol dehydrogenase family protein n=1 Tax=Microbacterium sp. NPDC076911 TaxID=3154958 RepID=UPI0034389ADB